MKTIGWVGAVILAGLLAAQGATNDLATALQKGLFEEEANRNLDAAIQAYQSVANRFDQDRRLAATAIYRLGECYRKQGDTNAATAQFQRVVREFSDQSALATLSRQNLATLGVAASGTAGTPASAAARQEQKRLMEEEIRLVQQQLDMQQKQVDTGRIAPGDLLPTQRDLLKLKRQLAALEAGQPVDATQGDANGKALPAAEVDANGRPMTHSEAEEVTRIQALIKDSPDLINATEPEHGTTPLHRAAQAGQLVVAQFLLANGADTEAKDTGWGGRTPLHYAAAAGHKAMVELLLSKGANAQATDNNGLTPLHLAAEAGYRSVVEVLLDHHAPVNAKGVSSSTPLLLAAAHGFRSVMEVLLAHGADINAATTSISPAHGGHLRGTALTVAAQRGDPAMAAFLLGKGAAVDVVNYDGRTPLSYAVEARQAPLVKLLLDAHANPNAGSVDLPLVQAAREGDLDNIKLLLAHEADPNTNCQVKWDFPAHYSRFPQGGTITPLFAAVDQHHPEAVQALIAGKADPNGLGPEGNPVMFETIYDAPTLQALLEGGADPNRPSARGDTALHDALQKTSDQAPVIALLLDHGADPNVAASNGWSPLHQAVWGGDPAVIQLLLKKGASVNDLGGEQGRTPLQVAIEKGNAEEVKLLLENGADPNARSKAGATPLEYAKNRPQQFGVPMAPPGMLMPQPGGPLRIQLPGANPPPRGNTPTPATNPPLPSIADLLRQHGALDDLPRMDAIEVRRPTTHYSSTINNEGGNEANRITLAEAIGVQYGLLWSSPSSDPDWRPNYNRLTGNSFNQSLPFPDLTHVRIRKPSPDLRSWQENKVDLTPLLEQGDCSSDVTLSWGEVVDIPEQDHALDARWTGFTAPQMEHLVKCLSRQVEIVIKGQATKVRLGPKLEIPGGMLFMGNPYGLGDGSAQFWVTRTNLNGQRGQVDVRNVEKGTLWLKPALLNSKLVLASSDLSRVKVTRQDLATGKKQEWVFDCTEGKPQPLFWLRDGDVIRVPEREDGLSSAVTPPPAPGGYSPTPLPPSTSTFEQRLREITQSASAPRSIPRPASAPGTNLPTRPLPVTPPSSP